MKDTQRIDLFQRARASTDACVIEGVQAIKHAARFKADFQQIVTCDISATKDMLLSLAPDISQMVLSQIVEVSFATFEKLSPQPPRTKIIAIAARKSYEITDINAKKPLVFLEDPRDLENIGAVIRVSAAADVAAVAVSGNSDIWHPAVIRGAAGLQYAVPVFNTALETIAAGRSIIALDPTGELAQKSSFPPDAVLVFGTERHGLTEAALAQAEKIIKLPMKKGVSSLNLATSVAATLYMQQG